MANHALRIELFDSMDSIEKQIQSEIMDVIEANINKHLPYPVFKEYRYVYPEFDCDDLDDAIQDIVDSTLPDDVIEIAQGDIANRTDGLFESLDIIADTYELETEALEEIIKAVKENILE